MVDRSFSVRLAAETAAYEQAMGRAEQATRRVGQEGEKAGSLIGRTMSAGVQTLAKTTAAAAAGAGILTAAVMKTGTSYNALEQRARVAFTTVLDSSAAANEMMEKVAEFASTSPFPRQAFIDATQQLLAFGVEADRVIPILGAVQDAVAAAGQPASSIGEVVNILAQVQSTGRFTAETLNQLGYRGVDAAQLMGDAFGISAAEMRQAISDGTYDAGLLLETLTDQMTETFGGAAENVKLTWDGAVDRIAGAFRDISSIIMEPFVSKAGGGYALDWVNAFADAMRALERQIEPLSIALTGRFVGSLDAITSQLERIAPAIDGFDLSVITDNLDDLVGYGPLVGAVASALVVMGTNTIPGISALGLAISPVTAGLAALVALHPDLRGLLGDFLSDLSPLVPVLQDTVLGLADAGTAIIDALLPGLSAILDAVAPAAVALGTTLGGSATILAQALVPIAEAVGEVISWIDAIPGSVTTAVLAFAAFKGVNLAGVLTPMRGLSEQMAVQQSLAKMGGQEVGRFGAAMGVAGRAATGFGGALKAAFIANPVGLALAGITTAVSLWQGAQAKATAEAEEARRRVDDLSASLDQNTGAYTENTRAMVAKRLQEEGLIATGQELGIASWTLVDAALGEADAIAEVTRKYQSGRDAVREYSRSHPSTKEGRERLSTLVDFAAGMRLVTEDAEQATAEILEQAEATGAYRDLLPAVGEGLRTFREEMLEAAAATDEMAGATDEAAQAAEEAREAHAQWITELGGISAGFVSLSDALSTVQGDTRAWAEEQAAAVEDAEVTWEDFYDGFSVNLDNYLAELESMVEAQANWQTNMSSLVGRVSDDTLDELARLGPEGAPLVQALVDGSAEQLAEFDALFTQSGADANESWANGLESQKAVVRAAARKLGDDAAAEINQAIVDGEITAAEAVKQYNLVAELELDDDPAAQVLLDFYYEVKDTTATAKIAADAGLALGTAEEWEKSTSDMIPVPLIDADAREAYVKAQDWYNDTADLIPVPVIDADAWMADREALGFYRRTEDLDPVVDVDADTAKASTGLDALFYRYEGKTISVNLKAGVIGSSNRPHYEADGGIVERANGGIDQAGQIVQRLPMMGGPQYGKTNILWGEPETGWEAYISGKPGMRNRNIAVLQEAAHRMGMTVLDGLGAKTFANGGLMDATLNVKGQPASGNFDDLLNDWADHNRHLFQTKQTGTWRDLWRMVQPWGVSLYSSVRPGAVTATGYRSKHAQGKAIDISNHYGLWKFLEAQKQNFGELYGPWGLWNKGANRWNMPGAAITARNHRDHMHIAAYENGGILDALSRPKKADTGQLTLDKGWNAVYNGLGRLEHLAEQRFTSTPAQPVGVAAPAPAGDTFHITNNYPVAEPASKTTQRARDLTSNRGRW